MRQLKIRVLMTRQNFQDVESETSAKCQPDKQNGVSDPMRYCPNKKKLEKPPRSVVSKSDMDAGPSEGARAPSREKKGTESTEGNCLG